MKRIITVLALFALMSGQAFAQLVPGAGYINSTLSVNRNGKVSSGTQNGFYAGASIKLDVPAVKGLGFVPGAYLSMISESSSNSSSLDLGFINLSQSNKTTYTEIALNVPLHFTYGLALSGGSKVFAYAGPTAQLGISSTIVSEDSGVITGSNTTDLYSGDKGYNRLNVFIGGGIGFAINRFNVNVGYDYGLMNVYRGVNDVTANRTNLHVGLGYSF